LRWWLYHFECIHCCFQSIWRTIELKKRKIRVNAVSPGSIDSQIFSPFRSQKEYEQFKNNIVETIPWVGWVILVKSQKLSHFLHQTIATISLA
jgi:NAD(P)-dependent dehydrogenase (short-subunit alcohol dehydrogenase family)